MKNSKIFNLYLLGLTLQLSILYGVVFGLQKSGIVIENQPPFWSQYDKVGWLDFNSGLEPLIYSG